MTAKIDKQFEKVFQQLEELGFLLMSGHEIPDVRRLIAGENSKGSWWADPAAHTIFRINELLSDHADVLVTKLISRKVTFVHRKVWSRLFAIATAREAWQLKGLSSTARSLLIELDKRGTIQTNKLGRAILQKPGDIARELELRLLVHCDQIHTESGAHAKLLESWDCWAKRVGFKGQPVKPSTARLFFEKRVEELNKRYDGNGQLPWPQGLL